MNVSNLDQVEKVLSIKQLEALIVVDDDYNSELSTGDIEKVCASFPELKELTFEIFFAPSPILRPKWPMKLKELTIMTHTDVSATVSLPKNLHKFKLIGSMAEGFLPSLEIADVGVLFNQDLQVIWIDDIWVEDSAFRKIAGCPNLKSVNLHVEGSRKEFKFSFPVLEKLDLTARNGNYTITCPKLTSLSLRCKKEPSIYNIISSTIQHLTIIQKKSKKLENWMENIFEQNKDLKFLFLDCVAKIEKVYPWNKLESLFISTGNINWNQYPSVKMLRFLRFPVKHPRLIYILPNLTTFSISHGSLVELLSLWTPKLEKLELGSVGTLKAVLPSKPFSVQLKNLILSPIMTLDCLSFLKPHSLTISYNRVPQDTDESWLEVCKEIKELKLKDNNNQRLTSLLKILGNQLETLTLKASEAEDVCMTIAKECTELKKLQISEDNSITAESLRVVILACQKIEEVVIRQCKKIRKGAFSNLKGIPASINFSISYIEPVEEEEEGNDES